MTKNEESSISNMLCGMISGASAISVCNHPTDFLKEVYHQESFSGLYRKVGLLPTYRGVLMELLTYDSSKKLLTTHLSMRPDSLATHLTAGSLTGLIATVAALPIDVIRHRMMSQRVVYQGKMDCLLTTVRSEGVAALYKGFLPSYLRIAPFNIIFFLTYEKLFNFKPQ
jgi:hypothetical protein